MLKKLSYFNFNESSIVSNRTLLSIVSTFIVTVGLTLLVTGKHLGSSSLVFCAYFSFGLLASISFFSKISIHMLKTLIMVIFLLILPLITHYYIYNDSTITFIGHYIIAILIGFFVSNIFIRIKWDVVLYLYSAGVFFLIFFFPDGINNYINRTYYTIPSTALLLCNAVADQFKCSKFNIMPVIITLFVAAVSMNRASTLLTLALVFVAIIVKLLMEKKTIKTLILRIILVFMLLFFTITLFDLITNLEIFKRFADRGLETGRISIWAWYLLQIDFDNLLIGTNVDDTMQDIGYLYFGEAGNYSLHNVFLHTFMQGGIFAFFFLIYMFFKLLKECSIGNDRILVTSVIGMVFIKSCVDISFFPQYTDWIYFSVLFFVSKKNKVM